MSQKIFLRNKINRQIKQNGSLYIFKRFGIDEYDQITDEIETTFEVNGLFHEIVKYVSISESDKARVIGVPKSYILCLFDEGDLIKIDDVVNINENKYRVTGKTNVGNYNVAYDISLELIVNGNKV